MEWQDIKTAPKDGTRILISCKNFGVSMLIKVLAIFLGAPIFVVGSIASFIQNSFMAGYCYIDNKFNPEVYKKYEKIAEINKEILKTREHRE